MGHVWCNRMPPPGQDLRGGETWDFTDATMITSCSSPDVAFPASDGPIRIATP
jgi:hypothetical protein